MKSIQVLIAVALFWAGVGQAISNPVAKANNEFGFELFRKSEKERSKDSNSMISPISAYLVLAMIANGAAGKTQSDLLKAMQSGGMDIKKLNGDAGKILAGINAENKDYILSSANGVYVPKKWKLNRDYVNNISEAYSAEIQNFDYALKPSLDLINAWVNAQTRGKIDKILNKLDEKVYLLNATYFKGGWVSPFNPANTKSAPFDGGSVQAQMMHQKSGFRYAKTDLAQVLEMKIGEAGGASCFFLLPTKDVATLASGLTNDKWEETLSKLAPTPIDLTLPKFSYSNSMNLLPSVAAMGAKDAFNGGDYSTMIKDGGRGFNIADFDQATYVGVYEQGMEAAAVTKGTASASMVKYIPFTVDRPFMYAVVDNDTGTILFLGSVTKPEFTL